MTTTTTTTSNERAKRLYLAYTNGMGYIERLYGPNNAAKRAEILSAVRGERVTKSKAGWNVFRDAMIELFGATGDCIAARNDSLAELAQAADVRPLCWCGAPMKPVGRGAYPYDCISKDRHPDAMIYVDCDNGHNSWTHEFAI